MARQHTVFLLLALAGAVSGGLLGGLFGIGDPQFRGLDGRVFLFEGFDGGIFNIVTEQNHQLNALFSAGPHQTDTSGDLVNGTYMTSFGLQMFQTKVEMAIDEDGEVTAFVNGERVDDHMTVDNDYKLEFEEPHVVYIAVEKYREDYGFAITARSALFEFILFATPKQYDPVVQEIARAHLNFELAANMEALKNTECHGVLGQDSFYSKSKAIPDDLSDLFLGEGSDEDYLVSSLFAADSTYNLFGRQTSAKAGSYDVLSHTGRPSAAKNIAHRSLREGRNSYFTFARVTGLI